MTFVKGDEVQRSLVNKNSKVLVKHDEGSISLS